MGKIKPVNTSLSMTKKQKRNNKTEFLPNLLTADKKLEILNISGLKTQKNIRKTASKNKTKHVSNKSKKYENQGAIRLPSEEITELSKVESRKHKHCSKTYKMYLPWRRKPELLLRLQKPVQKVHLKESSQLKKHSEVQTFPLGSERKKNVTKTLAFPFEEKFESKFSEVSKLNLTNKQERLAFDKGNFKFVHSTVYKPSDSNDCLQKMHKSKRKLDLKTNKIAQMTALHIEEELNSKIFKGNNLDLSDGQNNRINREKEQISDNDCKSIDSNSKATVSNNCKKMHEVNREWDLKKDKTVQMSELHTEQEFKSKLPNDNIQILCKKQENLQQICEKSNFKSLQRSNNEATVSNNYHKKLPVTQGKLHLKKNETMQKRVLISNNFKRYIPWRRKPECLLKFVAKTGKQLKCKQGNVAIQQLTGTNKEIQSNTIKCEKSGFNSNNMFYNPLGSSIYKISKLSNNNPSTSAILQLHGPGKGKTQSKKCNVSLKDKHKFKTVNGFLTNNQSEIKETEKKVQCNKLPNNSLRSVKPCNLQDWQSEFVKSVYKNTNATGEVPVNTVAPNTETVSCTVTQIVSTDCKRFESAEEDEILKYSDTNASKVSSFPNMVDNSTSSSTESLETNSKCLNVASDSSFTSGNLEITEGTSENYNLIDKSEDSTVLADISEDKTTEANSVANNEDSNNTNKSNDISDTTGNCLVINDSSDSTSESVEILDSTKYKANNSENKKSTVSSECIVSFNDTKNSIYCKQTESGDGNETKPSKAVALPNEIDDNSSEIIEMSDQFTGKQNSKVDQYNSSNTNLQETGFPESIFRSNAQETEVPGSISETCGNSGNIKTKQNEINELNKEEDCRKINLHIDSNTPVDQKLSFSGNLTTNIADRVNIDECTVDHNHKVEVTKIIPSVVENEFKIARKSIECSQSKTKNDEIDQDVITSEVITTQIVRFHSPSCVITTAADVNNTSGIAIENKNSKLRNSGMLSGKQEETCGESENVKITAVEQNTELVKPLALSGMQEETTGQSGNSERTYLQQNNELTNLGELYAMENETCEQAVNSDQTDVEKTNELRKSVMLSGTQEEICEQSENAEKSVMEQNSEILKSVALSGMQEESSGQPVKLQKTCVEENIELRNSVKLSGMEKETCEQAMNSEEKEVKNIIELKNSARLSGMQEEGSDQSSNLEKTDLERGIDLSKSVHLSRMHKETSEELSHLEEPYLEKISELETSVHQEKNSELSVNSERPDLLCIGSNDDNNKSSHSLKNRDVDLELTEVENRNIEGSSTSGNLINPASNIRITGRSMLHETAIKKYTEKVLNCCIERINVKESNDNTSVKEKVKSLEASQEEAEKTLLNEIKLSNSKDSSGKELCNTEFDANDLSILETTPPKTACSETSNNCSLTPVNECHPSSTCKTKNSSNIESKTWNLRRRKSVVSESCNVVCTSSEMDMIQPLEASPRTRSQRTPIKKITPQKRTRTPSSSNKKQPSVTTTTNVKRSKLLIDITQLPTIPQCEETCQALTEGGSKCTIYNLRTPSKKINIENTSSPNKIQKLNERGRKSVFASEQPENTQSIGNSNKKDSREELNLTSARKTRHSNYDLRKHDSSSNQSSRLQSEQELNEVKNQTEDLSKHNLRPRRYSESVGTTPIVYQTRQQSSPTYELRKDVSFSNHSSKLQSQELSEIKHQPEDFSKHNLRPRRNCEYVGTTPIVYQTGQQSSPTYELRKDGSSSNHSSKLQSQELSEVKHQTEDLSKHNLRPRRNCEYVGTAPIVYQTGQQSSPTYESSKLQSQELIEVKHQTEDLSKHNLRPSRNSESVGTTTPLVYNFRRLSSPTSTKSPETVKK